MYQAVPQHAHPTTTTALPPTGYEYTREASNVTEMEQQSRQRWRHRCMCTLVLCGVFVALGFFMLYDRNNLSNSACCLPEACHASKIKLHKTIGDVASRKPVCDFTREQMREMQCEHLFVAMHNCSLRRSYQCMDNQAHDCILGTYASQFSAAAVLLFLSLCFFSIGDECFGSAYRNKSCGNWCARITAGMFWALVVSSVLTSLVFVSMVIYFYNNRFSSYLNGCNPNAGKHEANHCDLDQKHHDSGHRFTDAEEENHKRHWAPMWDGRDCPLNGQAAFTFNAVFPTFMQRANAYATLCANVGFIFFSIYLVVAGIRSCCRARQQQQLQSGYFAPGLAQQVAYEGIPQAAYGTVAPPPEKPGKTV